MVLHVSIYIEVYRYCSWEIGEGRGGCWSVQGCLL